MERLRVSGETAFRGRASTALMLIALLCSALVAQVSASTSARGGAKQPLQPSARSEVESFKVMDVLCRANELEASGRSICHMEVGQPGTGAPQPVIDASKHALDTDKLGYTSSLGIVQLREKISKYYAEKYKVDVPMERIIITTGSSAAFMLSFLGLFDKDDVIALCSSGYPCYRNIMKATDLDAATIMINSDFKVTAKELSVEIARRAAASLPPLKGLILSSPGNPTGAMLSPVELRDLCALCEENDIQFISDEIYHGITYGTQTETTALSVTDQAVVINSFSKYFSMTGWRLGWMVVPPHLVDVMNRLNQNMFINAPTLSQIAACSAFDCSEELESHVKKYAKNREIVLQTLKELGIAGNIAPSDGAFYIYVDLKALGVTDSPALCSRILEEAGVAITPGVDFEDPATGLGLQRIRFSFSRDTSEVAEGMNRFRSWWRGNMKAKA